MKESQPLVSICTLAYNHEKYIRETIESFLMQVTSFPFEIIIHDDASTDKTAQIIREYEEKHPDIVKPIYQNENQWSKGIKASLVYVWPKARGKYIALCEGDDYWTDPLKIQKQAEFLEQNNDVSLVHTDFDYFNQSKNRIINNYYSNKSITFQNKYPVEEYLTNTFIRTVTVMMRVSELQGYEEVMRKKWVINDVPIFLYLARKSKIGYLNYSTAIYRRGKDTISTPQDIKYKARYTKAVSRIRLFFYHYLKIKNDSIRNKILTDYYMNLIFAGLLERNIVDVIKVSKCLYSHTDNNYFRISVRLLNTLKSSFRIQLLSILQRLTRN